MTVSTARIPEMESWNYTDASGQKRSVFLSQAAGIELCRYEPERGLFNNRICEETISFHQYLLKPSLLEEKLPAGIARQIHTLIQRAILR